MLDHCTKLASSVAKIIGVFRRCRKYLNYEQAHQLYTSFIRPNRILSSSDVKYIRTRINSIREHAKQSNKNNPQST